MKGAMYTCKIRQGVKDCLWQHQAGKINIRQSLGVGGGLADIRRVESC